MPDYRVNLCLVAKNTPTTFLNRFPIGLAAVWWDITLTANNETHLKVVICDRIRSDCLNDIENDLGAGAGDVIAFESTTWIPLGGGQHEYASSPIKVDYGLANPVAWRFTNDVGQKQQMHAGVRFYLKPAPQLRRKKKSLPRARRRK